ncbi:MAG TPA: glycosyltransferase [Solirubrobacteraceae bacterium]|nr:glycosyltransferase [Solirubrobacteraceae bacterium]
MAASEQLEVLLVSLGSTTGLRAADEELAASLRRAGAAVELARAQPPRPLRTMALTDLAWARAARAAARGALLERMTSGRAPGPGLGAGGRAPVVIYSSTTASLLWPLPGAVRFDACAASNRPGRHGLWQRPLERRRLASSPLLLPWSEGALEECGAAPAGARSLVIPVAVEPSGPALPPQERDIAALTYAANPLKKGLDRVLAAWRRLRAEPGAEPVGELLVAGTDEPELARAGIPVPGASEGVRLLGRLSPVEYRGLLRRARVFVCAPRREDYGISQLEALADGCMLVTTPAPGPYVGLAPARALDPRLVGEDLAAALRSALEDPRPGYAEDAARALAPFSPAALTRIVQGELLARLSAARPR